MTNTPTTPDDERAARRKEFDSPFINRLSAARHADDVRRNAEPRQWFPRKGEDTRSAKSKAFSRRWIGS